MATNQKEQGRDDRDQKSRGNSQENQSNENSGTGQEAQGNNDGKSNRGFAGIDDDRQRDIASKSGKAMHESSGHEHGFGSKEARKAGRKRSLL